jgi:type IV pilus assembly protein PilX
MTMPSSKSPLSRMPRGLVPSRRGQHGIVLFIALIVMVALSLAGIALIRSIDTTASVTGNIAFRQAAMLQANWAVEEAVGHVYAADSRIDPATLIDTKQDQTAQYYLASFDPAKDSTTTGQPALPAGVPDVLWKKGGAWPVANPPNGSQNKVKYVIQRMCSTAIASPADANQAQCELMTPKQSLGTTVGDEAISIGKYPLYRVTVRVDGPNNALTFVQAMIRG